jgi:hypothetical protein
MLESTSRLDQINYRLAILTAKSSSVLATINGHDFQLPQITVQRWERPARQIQEIARVRWDVSVAIIEFLANSTGSPLCIAELLSDRIPNELSPTSIDQLGMTELTSRESQIIREVDARDCGNRGTFSRAGWLQEAIAWMQRSIRHKPRLIGEIEQYNAGGSFALMRVALCEGTAYWLKAVGAPNLHEFPLTTALARCCPEYLPRIIATRNDWNAWVMEDAGISADRRSGTGYLECVVTAMAKLQQKTSCHIEELLSAGAADHRMKALAGHIDETIAYLDRTMRDPIPPTATLLRPERLPEIRDVLEESCAAMQRLCIPDTIIHNDMNRGNILLRRGRCTFTDWCEAGIGNPFLTLPHFQLLVPNGLDGAEEVRSRLQQLYRRCWTNLLSARQINQALALSPLLAMLSHLYGRGDWLSSDRGNDANVQRYARTIARRMDVAACAPELKDALCA